MLRQAINDIIRYQWFCFYQVVLEVMICIKDNDKSRITSQQLNGMTRYYEYAW